MSTQRGNSQCVNSHTVFQMTLYREPLGENKDCVLLANKHCWSWSISEEYWTTPRIFISMVETAASQVAVPALPYLLLPLSTMAEVLGYSSPPCLYGWAGG